MAILRSLDGRFYEVPDDQLDAFLVSADKVKEKLDELASQGQAPPPPGGPGGLPHAGSPSVLVQVFGPADAGPPPGPPSISADDPNAVAAYDVHWHNHHWHNHHWHNDHWHNHHWHNH